MKLRVAAAITTTIRDKAMQARAAALDTKISAEDGVACAVKLINATAR